MSKKKKKSKIGKGEKKTHRQPKIGLRLQEQNCLSGLGEK
jgi:hypothetical protein